MIPRARTVADLRRYCQEWRLAGQRIALVPTMGALHAGHLSLVDIASQHADRVIVSIFVNPTQFGPNEDFASYPRREESDLDLLNQSGVDLAYLPSRDSIYPDGFDTTIQVGKLANTLCGASRPGHFDGVALVVTKLLLQTQADIAIFGEKDFQQLAIIRRTAADLDLPVEIIGAPIVRDPDGLALSSRNGYLSSADRETAPQLHSVMLEVADRLARRVESTANTLAFGVDRLRHTGFRVDYLELVDPDSLQPVFDLERPARLLAAVFLGTTRLIDNIAVEPNAS